MGHAVDSAITLGEGDLSCAMTDMDVSCESVGSMVAYMPQSCCDNDHLSIQIKDDYQADSETISFEKQYLFAFTYAFLIAHFANQEHIFALSTNHSPPLDKDVQSMYQTFLL